MNRLPLLRQEVQPVLIIRKMALSEYQQLSTKRVLVQTKATSIQQCRVMYVWTTAPSQVASTMKRRDSAVLETARNSPQRQP